MNKIKDSETKTPILRETHSNRLWVCLKAEGITNYEDLLSITESQFLRIPNLGRKSLNEMKEYLRFHFPHIKIGKSLEMDSGDVPMTPIRGSDYLTVRIINALITKGINFYEDLIYHSESDLLRQANFGRKSLAELKDVLETCYPNIVIGSAKHKHEPQSFVYKSPSEEARLLEEANSTIRELMFAMRVMEGALAQAKNYLEKNGKSNAHH